VLELFGNFLIHSVGLATVLILLNSFDTLGGWQVGEITFVYGLGSLSFGMAQTLSTGLSGFSRLVRFGEFDRMLVRPVGTLIQVLTSDIQLRPLGRVLQGLLALGLAFQWNSFDWSLGRIIYLPIVVLSATLLFVSLFILNAAFCFWTTDATELVNALTDGGLQLALYPFHIFDAWLRGIFLFIVPLGLVIYAPVLYLLRKPDPLGLPSILQFVSPIASVAFMAIAIGIWNIGVLHYRSSGT